jgi:hypothetical protein
MSSTSRNLTSKKRKRTVSSRSGTPKGKHKVASGEAIALPITPTAPAGVSVPPPPPPPPPPLPPVIAVAPAVVIANNNAPIAAVGVAVASISPIQPPIQNIELNDGENNFLGDLLENDEDIDEEDMDGENWNGEAPNNMNDGMIDEVNADDVDLNGTVDAITNNDGEEDGKFLLLFLFVCIF